MKSRHGKIPHAPVKFRVDQHVRFSRAKLKFAKWGEHNYTTQIFRICKVVHRAPRPVYELQDLSGKHIDGQFYAEELSPVLITKTTVYAIDKILRTKNIRGIIEYLVRWRGYGTAFDSWIKASSMKYVG